MSSPKKKQLSYGGRVGHLAANDAPIPVQPAIDGLVQDAFDLSPTKEARVHDFTTRYRTFGPTDTLNRADLAI